MYDTDPVLDAVAALAATDASPLVLAVSGGRDSMALLEACARALPVRRVAAVATFDHGTGAHAARAADHVVARARAVGLPAVRGSSAAGTSFASPGARAATEAAWRAERWRFLDDVARRSGARVVTAHTRDDHVETVAMRALRGSGARGLAGMLAPGRALRPFLDLPRDAVARWALANDVRWVDDPSNATRRHLRNRVRLDILPALRAVRPDIDEELAAIAREAARVRAALDAAARAIATLDDEGSAVIAAADLAGYDAAALGALWPPLAALAGATLDRRGTSRAAAFTIEATTGGTIQLASGFEIVRGRRHFVVRRARRTRLAAHDKAVAAPLGAVAECGGFRLRATDAGRDEAGRREEAGRTDDAWSAWLPLDGALTVRAWRPGDRMRVSAGDAARRVKRYFGDAGIPGMDRAGWPVVLAEGEIVWIPGVRRSDAATVRSGRPGLRYVCERIRR